MRHGRDGGFGNFRVAHERALDFRRADAMAGNIDDIVHATEQPVIAIGIHAATVAGEIHIFVGGKIGVDETVVVAPSRPHNSRPRFFNAQFSAFVRFAFGAVVAQNNRLDAKKGATGAAGFECVRAGQGRDKMTASLRLPPSIHDGTTLAADVFVIPHPRFGIDRFADGAEHAERT